MVDRTGYEAVWYPSSMGTACSIFDKSIIIYFIYLAILGLEISMLPQKKVSFFEYYSVGELCSMLTLCLLLYADLSVRLVVGLQCLDYLLCIV